MTNVVFKINSLEVGIENSNNFSKGRRLHEQEDTETKR